MSNRLFGFALWLLAVAGLNGDEAQPTNSLQARESIEVAIIGQPNGGKLAPHVKRAGLQVFRGLWLTAAHHMRVHTHVHARVATLEFGTDLMLCFTREL